MMLVQPVPSLQLRDRHLKLARDSVSRIAAANRIEHAASRHHTLIAEAAGARLDHQSLAFYQRVSGPYIVQPRERGHRHAVSAGDGTQRLPRTDSINDLALPGTPDICLRRIHAGGGELYF